MLLPTPAASIDPVDVYAAPPRSPVGNRPWVVVNMIETVDGAATDASGLSGGLGTADDTRVLAAIRGVADLVLAGAGTVRAEGYGLARTSPAVEAARLGRGQSPRPRIVVVSASLRLDPAMRLFREAASVPPGERPLIVTVSESDPDARSRLSAVAEIVEAGSERVDWPRALATLRAATGASIVAAEGGPTVNGQLLAAGVIDEMCVTVAPALAGGDAVRIAHGPPIGACPAGLEHVLESDGYLWLRYVVRRGPAG